MSYGAVLRAWNKEDGPLRITQSSYGFEIMEEYNPEKHPEHLEAKKKRKFNDKLDGIKYLNEVIEWHVRKVSTSTNSCQTYSSQISPLKANAHSPIGRSRSNTQRILFEYSV